MIVCIAHAKVGYRQAIHRNPGLERVPGFFIGGRCPEPTCNALAAREVDRGSHDDPASPLDCSSMRTPRRFPAPAREGFRRAVLGFLVGKGAVSGNLRCKLLGWRHSGFSVHNQVRVEEGDAAGRSKLAAYMLRAPMSLEKIIYDADTGTVIYRSKMPASAAEATGGRGVVARPGSPRCARP